MVRTTAEQHVYESFWERIAKEEILPTITDNLIEEHRQNPFGHHSDELYRVLTFLRKMESHPEAPWRNEERYVVIMTELYSEWAIGKNPQSRGDPPYLVDDTRYETQAEVEHEVFLRRIQELRETFGEAPGSDEK
jgi:hypothetical protein